MRANSEDESFKRLEGRDEKSQRWLKSRREGSDPPRSVSKVVSHVARSSRPCVGPRAERHNSFWGV